MLEPNDVKRYQRELAAMLRRAGDEDPEGFAAIAHLLTSAVDGLGDAARNMRRRGYSWREISNATGMPTATVHRKWAGEGSRLYGSDALRPSDPEVTTASINEELNR